MTTAIFDFRPTAPPAPDRAKESTSEFVRLFALDRLPQGRRPLVCHWQRDADGRLACRWEPDIPPMRGDLCWCVF